MTQALYGVSSSSAPATQPFTYDPQPPSPLQAEKSFESTHTSVVPIDEVNPKWCVMEMYMIYNWDSFISEEGQRMRSIQQEKGIEIVGIVGVPNLWTAFDRYQLGWIIRPKSSYRQALVQRFYLSYDPIVSLTIPRGSTGPAQYQIKSSLRRGMEVGISVVAIYRVFFGKDYVAPIFPGECDHRLIFIQDIQAMRDADHRRHSPYFVIQIANLVFNLGGDAL